jgi:Ribonuclease G/E
MIKFIRTEMDNAKIIQKIKEKITDKKTVKTLKEILYDYKQNT